MAKRNEKKKSRRGTEGPTVFTAAGLLAFYQEEEAVAKLSPLAVVVTAAAFIALIAALQLIH